jgi:uncharacterized damage-inducible protein DinB
MATTAGAPTIGQTMAMELEHESATTRKLLERIPEETFGYKPHEKSMTMTQLASHIAEIPMWLQDTISKNEYIMDMATYVPFEATSQAQLLETFDANLRSGLEALRTAPDAGMMETWRMKGVDGTVFFELPRISVLRGMILNHIIHHRGQLGVYLRLNDIPLPQTYGPSADDSPMGG